MSNLMVAAAEWFEQHEFELLQLYNGQFLVINNEGLKFNSYSEDKALIWLFEQGLEGRAIVRLCRPTEMQSFTPGLVSFPG